MPLSQDFIKASLLTARQKGIYGTDNTPFIQFNEAAHHFDFTPQRTIKLMEEIVYFGAGYANLSPQIRNRSFDAYSYMLGEELEKVRRYDADTAIIGFLTYSTELAIANIALYKQINDQAKNLRSDIKEMAQRYKSDVPQTEPNLI